MAILAFFGISFGDKPTDESECGDVSAAVYEDRIEISLVANPSTGYSWTVEQEGSSVEFRSETFKSSVSSSDVAIAGAPGESVFTYDVVSEGQTKLIFRYRRSWEEEPPIDSHYLVIIDVGSDLSASVQVLQSKG